MQLTGLGKALIAVIVVGAAGSVLWNMGGKMWVQDKLGKTEASHEVASQSSGSAPAVVAGSSGNAPAASPAAAAPKGGALGSPGNPLKVSIVSFHGYAPALVANGNSLKTQPGSIFQKAGVNVEFIIQDDIPTLTTIFESNTAQCAWRTSDFWAQEQPNLINTKLDGRAIMIVDNTQGADAVIARDPEIKRIEDLVGKKVALLKYTPSHGLFINAINNSSLSAKQKANVLDRVVYINADEGTPGVRAAFAAGSVDAAVLWDPDLSLAVKSTPGARVVYSTKVATNLIYDVMVCNQKLLQDPANQQAFQGFVKGWMDGVTAARANPAGAAEALVRTEPFFDQLAKKEGMPFISSLFSNLVWTGLDDNARILGLAGDTNHYERVYREFDAIYRAAGSLANPNSPVVSPQNSFDYRFINALLKDNQAARAAAAKPEFTFDTAGMQKAEARPAALTKPVSVNFPVGQAELTKKAQEVIDTQVVPFINSNGSAYFEISGNTDSTGSAQANQRLSKARADAVTKYVVTQWEIPAARFKVVGNGSNNPICNEANPGALEVDLDTCRQMNRATRIAVLAR